MGYVSLAPGVPRVLPTAEELGDVYGRHQLEQLICLAARCNDQPAVALLEAAIRFQEKAELRQALNPDRLREMRAQRAQSRREEGTLKQQFAMGRLAESDRGLDLSRYGLGQTFPAPRNEASSFAQSAGPSE